MSTVNDEVLAQRRRGGFCCLDEWRALRVTGADAASFLQTRFSNDVKALMPGQGQMTALLDRKAHVLAYLSLHRLDDEFVILVDSAAQQAFLLEELERFHFNEKVSFSQRDGTIWTVQGPRAEQFISSGAGPGQQPVQEGGIWRSALWNKEVLAIARSLTGDPGFILLLDDPGTSELEAQARALEMTPLSSDALNVLRVEAGLLKFTIDFTCDSLMPETGLENSAASYSKGCFQGQEVLARIRTFGAPRRGMIGLRFPAGTQATFPIGTAVHSSTHEEIGALASNVYSPTLDCTVAFTYLIREERVPDRELPVVIDGNSFTVKLVTLPFYSGAQKKQRAKELYDRGLAEFAGGSEAHAIELLRQSIDLDPVFADSYEALGVILSRQNQLDEAINWMKRLEQLDPDSIMAHSNLSVFYMQQGNKELAEEEKAKAMSIRMSLLARQVADDHKEREDAARKKEEAEGRMDLFRQVLAIDAEDFLANSGMGSALVDMEKFDQALPYLEKALSVKTNHTLTYLALGQAYEMLGRTQEALDTYRQGVTVASQRGEMTPLKDMQGRIQRLSSDQSTSLTR